MVLIELYDMQEPVHNVIALTAFQPEHLIVICRGKLHAEKAKKTLSQYIRSAGLCTNTEYRICDPYDLAACEAVIEKTIDQYGEEDCLIDVIGGSEMLLLSVGSAAKGKNVRIITQMKNGKEFVWLKGEPLQQKQNDINIDVAQAIALSGGELTRNARVSEELFHSDFMKLVPQMFALYMRYRRQWPSFVLYMQRLNKPEYRSTVYSEELRYRTPKVVYLGRKRLCPQVQIFYDLKEAGALCYFCEEEKHYHMQFSSDEMLKYLCDVGAWLELYAYHLFQKCKCFADVQMSAVISWDEENERESVINEIDLIATEGKGQLFVSCKTALPDTAVLNEIAALTSRFGSSYAIPVIVTASNLEKESPGVYRRAAEMGIAIFDADDLNEERFIERMQLLRRRWN